MRMYHDLPVVSVSMKAAVLILIMLALSACGAVRAVRETERLADKYECLARELKGEVPCKPES
jgi:hypothetical protein